MQHLFEGQVSIYTDAGDIRTQDNSTQHILTMSPLQDLSLIQTE